MVPIDPAELRRLLRLVAGELFDLDAIHRTGVIEESLFSAAALLIPEVRIHRLTVFTNVQASTLSIMAGPYQMASHAIELDGARFNLAGEVDDIGLENLSLSRIEFTMKHTIKDFDRARDLKVLGKEVDTFQAYDEQEHFTVRARAALLAHLLTHASGSTTAPGKTRSRL